MTYYNMTFMDNSTSLLTIVKGVNDASNMWMFNLLLIITFIMIFIVFNNREPKSVFLGGSFVCTLLAALLWGAGLVGLITIIICTSIFTISLIFRLIGGD